MKSSLFNAPQSSQKILYLTLGVTLLLILWIFWPYLWDKYRVVVDTQHYYWMARAQDPTLFPTDYIYISSWQIIKTDILGFQLLLYVPGIGWGLFFYLASVLIDYVWLSKWTVLILGPLSALYLFKTGSFLKNNLTGLSLSLIFVFFALASPLSTSFATGLQRAFALPLLIVFLYYLVQEKYIGAAVTIFVSTLIYLPDFPLMVIMYALSFLRIKRPLNISLNLKPVQVISFIGALLFSSVFVLLALVAQRGLLAPPAPPRPTPVFPDVSKSLHLSLTDGPTPLFLSFPFLGRAGIFDTGGDVLNFLVMSGLMFLIYKIVGRRSLRQIPGAVWSMLVAGFIMYFASLFFVLELSSFALYLPSRYTRSVLLLTALFFVGLNWTDFLNKLPDWLRRNRRLLIFFCVSLELTLTIVYALSPDRRLLIPNFWFFGLILSGIFILLGASLLFWLAATNFLAGGWLKWGAFLGLGLMVAYLGTTYINIVGLKTINPSQAEREVYEFVAALPKEAMLAGDPEIMTNIPLFSKRSILFRALFPDPNAPFIEYFEAQYAESMAPIIHFCQRYQVDYLVINTEKLTPDYMANQNFFYDPWNDSIVDRVAGHSDLIIPQLEPIFASGPFRVIQCDPETFVVDD